MSQKKFHAFFRSDANTHLMFGELHDRISKAMVAAKKRKKEMKGTAATAAGDAAASVQRDDDADASERYLITVLLRFLQLLCEGHNNKLQRFLNQQAGAAKSYDLVSETVLYVQLSTLDTLLLLTFARLLRFVLPGSSTS
jgi:hypothetical protein